MLTQSLPCPHCNQSIKGTAFKGFMGIKSCPHCNKKIKLRKGPAKKLLLAFFTLDSCYDSTSRRLY